MKKTVSKMVNVFMYYSVNTEIIGVVGDEIIIKGNLWDQNTDEDYEEVGIVIKTDTYKEMMNEWIEEKKDYCERFEYICGWGNVSGGGIVNVKNILGEEYFDCTGIELCVDMEHG